MEDTPAHHSDMPHNSSADVRDQQINGFMQRRRASLGLESPAAIRKQAVGGGFDASGDLAHALAEQSNSVSGLQLKSKSSAY